MCVLVEEAAESVVSTDVKAVEAVRVGDWVGEWLQGSCAVQGAVRSMLVVDRLELVERVEQVGLVPDEGAVEEFVAAGLHPALHD